MASDSVAAAGRGGAGGRRTSPRRSRTAWQRWNDYGIGLLARRGRQGGPEGRAEAGRAGLPEGRRARPGRRLGEPGPRLPEGRPDPRRPRGPGEGRRAPEARRPLGDQLADRPDQRPQRPARRGDRQLRVGPGDPDPRRGVRLQPRLRGHQRPGLGALRPGARSSRSRAPSGRDCLAKAVAAYRRTLAIDSENVAAHYGLGLAYADPAWGETGRPRPADAGEPTGRAGRPGRAARSWPPRSPTARRPPPSAERSAPLELAGAVAPVHRRSPRPEFESRLEPLHEVVERLGPVWERETDPDAQAALARALEVDAQGACTSCSSPTRPPRAGPFAIARQERPGRRPERPVDRDPPAAPPGRPGIDAAATRGRGTRRLATIPDRIERRLTSQESGE